MDPTRLASAIVAYNRKAEAGSRYSFTLCSGAQEALRQETINELHAWVEVDSKDTERSLKSKAAPCSSSYMKIGDMTLFPLATRQGTEAP